MAELPPGPPMPPPGAEPRLRRLSELDGGSVARLHQRELSDGEACLLSAMGLTAGCRLTVRVSGDPCVVEVRATRIGIARALAEKLIVLSDGGMGS